MPYLYGTLCRRKSRGFCTAWKRTMTTIVAKWWKSTSRTAVGVDSNPSVTERTEWLMRKLSGKIFPIASNFIKFKLKRVSRSTSHFLRRLKADTRDPDPPMAPSVLDNRLSFLDWCQTNQLQFDQLRRAKYSSSIIMRRLLEDRLKKAC